MIAKNEEHSLSFFSLSPKSKVIFIIEGLTEAKVEGKKSSIKSPNVCFYMLYWHKHHNIKPCFLVEKLLINCRVIYLHNYKRSLRGRRSSRVAALTNQMRAGSRWRLNCGVKTAADDDWSLPRTHRWPVYLFVRLLEKCRRRKFIIPTSTAMRSSSTGNV